MMQCFVKQEIPLQQKAQIIVLRGGRRRIHYYASACCVESSLEGERQKSGQHWAVEPALPLGYDARYTNRTEDARKRTFVG
jgi:hypothetical protein